MYRYGLGSMHMVSFMSGNIKTRSDGKAYLSAKSLQAPLQDYQSWLQMQTAKDCIMHDSTVVSLRDIMLMGHTRCLGILRSDPCSLLRAKQVP